MINAIDKTIKKKKKKILLKRDREDDESNLRSIEKAFKQLRFLYRDIVVL